MSKPIVGLILGGILGALDGLSALLSAPEVKPMIAGIVIGSTIKGLIAGVLIGLFARRKASMPAGLLVGFGIGLLLAFHHRGDPGGRWQPLLVGNHVARQPRRIDRRIRHAAVRAPRGATGVICCQLKAGPSRPRMAGLKLPRSQVADRLQSGR